MKKILIIGATHGNEKIGVEVAKKLRNCGLSKYFDFLIGNPQAEKQNIRFIDTDLNRSYPGNRKSKNYEGRRAYTNLLKAKKYKYIIDIHEASCGGDDFIIIPREEFNGEFPIGSIDLKKVLLWPDPKGPLGEVLPNAIELEFGMKDRDRKYIVNKATKILIKCINVLLQCDYNNKSKGGVKIKEVSKKMYYVYGKLLSKEVDINTSQKLEDFKLAKRGGESFYPLLVNQYIKDGIICHKMKKYD